MQKPTDAVAINLQNDAVLFDAKNENVKIAQKSNVFKNENRSDKKEYKGANGDGEDDYDDDERNIVVVDAPQRWGARFEDRFTTFFFIPERDRSMRIMLGVRVASLFIATVAFSLTYYVAKRKGDFFLYYSHWSFVALMLMLSLGITSSACAYAHRRFAYIDRFDIRRRHLKWYVRMQWCAFNVACCTNMLTSVAYFIMTGALGNRNGKQYANVVITSSAHFINSALVFVELLTSGVPVRWRDFYQPMLFNVAYGVFFVASSQLMGRPVYEKFTSVHDLTLLSLCFIIIMSVCYCLAWSVNAVKCNYKKYVIAH
ncbi:hypothetical protein [Lambdina fiscellaria nucleopolyhedrovirus]|uniref:Uncharacterized protein n=1 Tax=Lambdina fiscellaria nucleopolyhedrovirus TaxID=1642929 RepID=A0A0E3URP4_9ABAC|nr:hypothetical protein [Lambdina fiscellaria nucleopolyhedrovirus]AKC91644.1 hypothetical protein [Lambdina fiscellaria nucleopolyhedrovirus]